MLTVVLPGLSKTNITWLRQLQSKLKVPGELYCHEWKTWSTNERFNYDYEVGTILRKLKNHKEVNFIAKSIGTKVLMKIIPHIKTKIKKVVLCGIPIDPIAYYSGMKLINPKNLLIIQNSRDPYMPYALIKVYLYLVNKNITVVEQKSNTHDYPYYNIFRDWIFSE